MAELTLTREDVHNIPEDKMPMMVFSDSVRSFFSWGIKAREKGYYNHFMVLHRKGFFASQDWIFHEVPVDEYLAGDHRLKFVYMPNVHKIKRIKMLLEIEKDLKRPWYKRMYDPVAILGQAIGLNFIQMPGCSICSDYGKYWKIPDPDYGFSHPSPPDINAYTKSKQDRYSVYGRFAPD